MIDPIFRNVRFLPGTINAGFPSPVCYVDLTLNSSALFKSAERQFHIISRFTPLGSQLRNSHVCRKVDGYLNSGPS